MLVLIDKQEKKLSEVEGILTTRFWTGIFFQIHIDFFSKEATEPKTDEEIASKGARFIRKITTLTEEPRRLSSLLTQLLFHWLVLSERQESEPKDTETIILSREQSMMLCGDLILE
jgi:hypothetical protein